MNAVAKVAMCATQCGLAAAPGDVYCAGCRSGVDTWSGLADAGLEQIEEVDEPSDDRTPVEVRLRAKLTECELKAWDSLARYKFIMFGYWAAQWVLCRSVLSEARPNPFASLVKLAREQVRNDVRRIGRPS